MSELEQINENDIMQALGGEAQKADKVADTGAEELTNIPEELIEPGTEESLPAEEIESVQEIPENMEQNDSSRELNISSSSLNDLTAVLSKLLNNKTIEITIKVKD